MITEPVYKCSEVCKTPGTDTPYTGYSGYRTGHFECYSQSSDSSITAPPLLVDILRES